MLGYGGEVITRWWNRTWLGIGVPRCKLPSYSIKQQHVGGACGTYESHPRCPNFNKFGSIRRCRLGREVLAELESTASVDSIWEGIQNGIWDCILSRHQVATTTNAMLSWRTLHNGRHQLLHRRCVTWAVLKVTMPSRVNNASKLTWCPRTKGWCACACFPLNEYP